MFDNIREFEEFRCPIVLAGDFNLPHIDWKIPAARSLYRQENYLECFLQLGFNQYVTEPTRGPNTLDLVFCNEENFISDVFVHDPLSSSDHNIVSFCFPFRKRLAHEPRRNWHKCFYFGFERALENVPWFQLFEACENVNEMYEAFLNTFNSCVEAFVPFSAPNKAKNRMSKFCRKLLHKRRQALRRMRKDNSPLNRAKFNTLNIKFTNAVKNDTRQTEQRILNKPDPKKFYAYVRSKTKLRPKIPTLKQEDGTYALSDVDKANLFNAFFVSNFSTDNGHPPLLPGPNQGASMPASKITRTMVHAALRSFPNKLSAGPDDIPALALKKLSVQLCVPLQYIFQRSLDDGEIPNIWRKAIVTPLYKGKGKFCDVKNYRPISQTSNVCKAMEKVIKCQMLEFLNATGAISNLQHGFMKNRSTLSQLLDCINIWTKSINAGEPIDVIYLDVAKAFDSVSHEKLLRKLDYYGIRAKWHCWIKSFLSQRTQKVKVENDLSNVAPVSSGVPQGSVLGPVLFILYINDLVNVIQNSNIRLYADDGKIFFKVGSDADFNSLQQDVNAVYHWMQDSQLSLALNKCEILHLGFSNPCRSLDIAGNEFQTVKVVKDLGIYISDDLKFSYHIDKIVSTAYSRIQCIFRTFSTNRPSFLCKMFCVYVRPLLEYNTAVWNPYLHKDVQKVESVQRFFTKRIPGLAHISYLNRLSRLGLETLELRRLKFDLLEVFKIVNGIVDLNFDDFFYNK